MVNILDVATQTYMQYAKAINVDLVLNRGKPK